MIMFFRNIGLLFVVRIWVGAHSAHVILLDLEEANLYKVRGRKPQNSYTNQ